MKALFAIAKLVARAASSQPKEHAELGFSGVVTSASAIQLGSLATTWAIFMAGCGAGAAEIDTADTADRDSIGEADALDINDEVDLAGIDIGEIEDGVTMT